METDSRVERDERRESRSVDIGFGLVVGFATLAVTVLTVGRSRPDRP